MADFIGRIEVPEITPSGTWPLLPLAGSGARLEPEVAVHAFRSGSVRIEQRFLLGNGAQRFHFVGGQIGPPHLDALRSFWHANQGAWGAFTYNAPSDSAFDTTTPVIVRFAQLDLTFDFLTDWIATVGIEFVEVPTGPYPTYEVDRVVLRIPDEPLSADLLAQAHEFIPLVRIRVHEEAVDDILLSDRRVTIGGDLYLPRLLKWDGISQSLGGEPDQAVFTFGNADMVMQQLMADTELFAADIEFSLFHVNSLVKIDLWKGHIIDAAYQAETPEFRVTAGDGLYALSLTAPKRQITRTCWKLHKGPFCPNATEGTNAATPCDKSFDGPAGCQFHQMENWFGGIIAKPQPVRTKDNSTGTWGFGRSPLNSASLISSSIYEEVLPEHYCNNFNYPLPVRVKLLAGRDEGDFYNALGLIGAGPIGAIGGGSKLDGSLNHGPGNYGLRLSTGHDPNPDPFSLGEGGHNQAQVYGPERAAGVAFIEIRRSDTKSLQLTTLAEHSIESFVAQGMFGWIWGAPGVRALQGSLTNPIWIAANLVLRALNLDHEDIPVLVQEAVIDVAAALSTADNVCNVLVPSLVARKPPAEAPPPVPPADPNDEQGFAAVPPPAEVEPVTVQEPQFEFTGSIQEVKPLRDWLREVLNSCLGFYTFRFGRIRFGSRFHSGATDTYTEGNIIVGSLAVNLHRPAFNRLKIVFADEEFAYVSNSVEFYDIDHALRIGRGGQPTFLPQELSLAGVSKKSHALRLLICRLREELGGATPAEQLRARDFSWKTTLLALASECGNVASITHPDAPAGSECRIERWQLNPDYSISLSGRPTTDSMYEYVTGPKPSDSSIPELPVDPAPRPASWGFTVYSDNDGLLRFRDLHCQLFARSVIEARFDVYYVAEASAAYCSLVGGCDNEATSLPYVGQAPEPGEWIRVRGELMKVIAVDDENILVERGQLGTAAIAHARSASAITAPAHNASFEVEGTAWYPGELATLDPSGEWMPIADFTAPTMTMTMPYLDLTGQSVYTDPRIWRVRKTTVVVSLPPRFFVSPARAQWEYSHALPHAGVVLVEGLLRNQQGLESAPVRQAFQRLLRTDGGNAFEFVHSALLEGAYTDAFEPLRVPMAQSFRRATMRVTLAVTGPLPIPRAVPSLRRGPVAESGTLVVGGTITPGDTVIVTIGSPASLSCPQWTVGDEATLEEVAAHLAVWLDLWTPFAAFFAVRADELTLTLLDRTGLTGELATVVSGTLTLTPGGFAPPLAITRGRRYVISHQTALAEESTISGLSASSGPSGDAASIDIEIPIPEDPRVTTVRIWATPDGQDGPFRLVGTCAADAGIFSDTTAEADLAAGDIWYSEIPPPFPGTITVVMKRDGNPWFELRWIDGLVSPLDGVALDPAPEGSMLNADVTTSIELAGCELRILLD